jgi:hypothetical protein
MKLSKTVAFKWVLVVTVTMGLVLSSAQQIWPEARQAAEGPEARPKLPTAVTELVVARADDGPPALNDAIATSESQPWEATPENSSPIPAGQIPAWQVNSPPPGVNGAVLPVVPAPPAGPTVRPPMHNPGGVDGDRPPRTEIP